MLINKLKKIAVTNAGRVARKPRDNRLGFLRLSRLFLLRKCHILQSTELFVRLPPRVAIRRPAGRRLLPYKVSNGQ